jgi:hypothetical protein
MNRIRLPLALCAVVLVLGAAPVAFAQEEAGGGSPAVVVEEPSEALEEEAWTFRFLIPTLLLATGAVVAIVVIGYGVRVRGRYRVTP